MMDKPASFQTLSQAAADERPRAGSTSGAREFVIIQLRQGCRQVTQMCRPFCIWPGCVVIPRT